MNNKQTTEKRRLFPPHLGGGGRRPEGVVITLLLILLLTTTVTAQKQRWTRMQPLYPLVELPTPDSADLLLFEDATDTTFHSIKLIDLPLSQAATDSLNVLKVLIEALQNYTWDDVMQNGNITSQDAIVNQTTPSYNLYVNDARVARFWRDSKDGTIYLSSDADDLNIESGADLNFASTGITTFKNQVYGVIATDSAHFPIYGQIQNEISDSIQFAKDSIPILSARSLQNESDIVDMQQKAERIVKYHAANF